MIIDFKKLFKSFKTAFFGLGYAIKNENTIRAGAIITIAMLFLAFYFPLTAVERSIIILSIVVVMGTELLNTRLERISDIIDEEHNEKIKIIKDVSAGTTLLCVIGAGIIGFLIFLSYI